VAILAVLAHWERRAGVSFITFSRNMSNIFGMSYLPHVSHVLCDADLAISILVNSGTRMVFFPSVKRGDFSH